MSLGADCLALALGARFGLAPAALPVALAARAALALARRFESRPSARAARGLEEGADGHVGGGRGLHLDHPIPHHHDPNAVRHGGEGES